MALIAYTTRHYTEATDSPNQRKWVSNLARVVGSLNVTTQEVTSLLSLLSASVMNASPLPPYLKAPPSYELAGKLEKIDPAILSINHIAEPGYAAFVSVAGQTVSNWNTRSPSLGCYSSCQLTNQ